MWGRKARLIADLQGVIANYAREERRLNEKVAWRDSALEKAQAIADTLQKENEGCLGDLKNMGQRIAELDAELAEARQKVARAESSADAAIQAGGIISDQLHEAQADIARKRATIDALTSELQSAKARLQGRDVRPSDMHNPEELESAFHPGFRGRPFKPTTDAPLPDEVTLPPTTPETLAEQATSPEIGALAEELRALSLQPYQLIADHPVPSMPHGGLRWPVNPTLPEVAELARAHAASRPCCDLHKPADDGGVSPCCDPEDCGPCCPDCPTCPTVKRMKDAPDPTGGWTKGPQGNPPPLS